ncbi:MAG: hypothetical protein KBS60_00150 [Phascolarctobacterium sp.]|nr:hypothetical protein [Candidatus Phascolarctobacterium caballi]
MKNDETLHEVLYYVGENYKVKAKITQEQLADLLKKDEITLISVNAASNYYRRPGRKKK